MKQPKSILLSTILLGVMLFVALILGKMLFSANLHAALDEYYRSAQNESLEDAGEMGIVMVLIGGIGALALTLMHYAVAIVAIIISIIALIRSMRNQKRKRGIFRFINRLYSIGFVAVLVFSIVKIVLFSTGN